MTETVDYPTARRAYLDHLVVAGWTSLANRMSTGKNSFGPGLPPTMDGMTLDEQTAYLIAFEQNSYANCTPEQIEGAIAHRENLAAAWENSQRVFAENSQDQALADQG